MTQIIDDVQHILKAWEAQGETLGLNSGSYGQRTVCGLKVKKFSISRGLDWPVRSGQLEPPSCSIRFKRSTVGAGFPVFVEGELNAVVVLLN